MTVDAFIEGKSKQLKWYVEAYLNDQLDYQEVRLMVWDILEEWNQLRPESEQLTAKEQVFWHLIHQLQRWPEQQLKGNLFIRHQLQTGVIFLNRGGPIPFACQGLRP